MIDHNKVGFCFAREAGGGAGGLFLSKSPVVDFARAGSGPLRCALIVP